MSKCFQVKSNLNKKITFKSEQLTIETENVEMIYNTQKLLMVTLQLHFKQNIKHLMKKKSKY